MIVFRFVVWYIVLKTVYTAQKENVGNYFIVYVFQVSANTHALKRVKAHAISVSINLYSCAFFNFADLGIQELS